jgi:hypothetical protein
MNTKKMLLIQQYKSTYERNIFGREGPFSGPPLHTQHQDEPPPPNPQWLCPHSPWQHQPCNQSTAPHLPMSHIQALGCVTCYHYSPSPCFGCQNNWEMGGTTTLSVAMAYWRETILLNVAIHQVANRSGVRRWPVVMDLKACEPYDPKVKVLMHLT